MATLPLPPVEARTAADVRVDISRQRLANAVQQLALQSGRQVVFRSSVIGERLSPRLAGMMSFEAALRRLLKGSGLGFRETAGGVIVIDPLRAPTEPLVPGREGARPTPVPALVVTAARQTDPVSFFGDLRLRPRPSAGIAALLDSSPGISSEPGNAGQNALIVRGVGMAGEATTLVYFADVPVVGPSGTGSDAARTTSDLSLVDVAQVRISRTARSAEHGVGALAGEIEIEPEEPHLGQWGGGAGLSLGIQQGGEPGLSASSTLNIPLGTRAALRATAYASREGGYVDNVRTGARNINDDDISGLRLIARIAPQPDLDISALLAWQHRRIADASSWFQSLGPYRTDRYFAAATTHDFLMGRLKIGYGTGAIRLTSITSAYRWTLDRHYDRTNATLLQGQDPDGCQRYFGLDTPTCDPAQAQQFADYAASLAPSLLHIPIVSTRILQELRLSHDNAHGLGWIAGVLIDHRTERLRSELSSYSDDPGATGEIFGARRLAITRDQAALFGTLSYREEDLLVSLGLRYDDYRVSSQNDVVVPNLLSGSIDSWPRTVNRSGGLSARLHVDLPIAPGATWHTQLTRSIRPGGVNTASVLLADRRTYDGDSLWGAELGLNLHLGRDVEMTLTAYMNDWRDMQYRALSENRSHAYLVNIGNAMILGSEFELVARPLPGLTARLEASLIRSDLTRVSDAASLVGGAEQGDAIPFVPHRRLRVSLTHGWAVGGHGQLAIEGDGQYQSGSWSTFTRDDPDFTATKGFSLFGAALTWRRERTSLSLRARNIFNRVANLRAVTNGYGVGQTFSSGPRSIQLSWDRHW
ncbi:TonB-dependent receptor [Sphingobium sp. AP49]|uniref:TonB-dependent receptor domain-containing protein n=1 Tax=Sphingobium sp. AP49 TaxID=1144307 RepID=UPI00026EDF9D|nr:TonB-dependent receptor [Sphingobium sp. AP49]WHO40988.1 TonB-dependent receptor [Sphingobium sp. AP49]